MKLNQIIKKSNQKNLFTIISDDETCVLLFEGKTVLAASGEDFHCGHEDAFFNKNKVKARWKSPLELHSRILKQFKIEGSVLNEHITDENLFSFLDTNDLYCSDDSFQE